MKVKVTTSIDAATIMRLRGLGESKKAEKFLASEVKRLCDPYVPMQQGTLKNTARVAEDGGETAVIYGQPYAHYQYYGEAMAGVAPKQYTGKALTYNGAPMRGANWDKRMLADRGSDLVKSLAQYVGGRAK